LVDETTVKRWVNIPGDVNPPLWVSYSQMATRRMLSTILTDLAEINTDFTRKKGEREIKMVENWDEFKLITPLRCCVSIKNTLARILKLPVYLHQKLSRSGHHEIRDKKTVPV
jgi:hypothetical protein